MQNNPNPNQGRGINTQPNQENMDKLGQTQDRNINIQDDKVVIQTDVNTVLAPEHVAQRYNKLVNQVRQTDKTVKAYDDKMEEVLDEYNLEMGLLHTIVDDHIQDDPDNIPDREELVNMLSSIDIQRFNNLQELHSQTDQMIDKIGNALDDLEDLHQAAVTMADRHEIELEERSLDTIKEGLYVLNQGRLER